MQINVEFFENEPYVPLSDVTTLLEHKEFGVCPGCHEFAWEEFKGSAREANLIELLMDFTQETGEYVRNDPDRLLSNSGQIIGVDVERMTDWVNENLKDLFDLVNGVYPSEC